MTTDVFATFGGLPLHPLIIHATVVFVPLLVLFAIGYAVVPRLRGRGIKGGDQYIEIKVMVPAPRDDRSRELIEEFARLNPQTPRAGLPWS